MGSPTLKILKAMISMNVIKKNVLATDDVNLATKYHSMDDGGIKGKTTRSRPTLVFINIVEILDDFLEIQQNLTVSMDRLIMKYLKFLSTIYHELYYRTAQHVVKPVASVYTIMNFSK